MGQNVCNFHSSQIRRDCRCYSGFITFIRNLKNAEFQLEVSKINVHFPPLPSLWILRFTQEPHLPEALWVSEKKSGHKFLWVTIVDGILCLLKWLLSSGVPASTPPRVGAVGMPFTANKIIVFAVFFSLKFFHEIAQRSLLWFDFSN